jgi:hypothetical protein
VAALLLGTAVSIYFAVQATHRAEEAESAQRDGQEKLLQSLLAEARARRFSGQTGQRFESLQALTRAAELARRLNKDAGTFYTMRNLGIAALALPDVHLEKQWDGWPEGSCHLAFDDQLERYARSDLKGNITVRRLADDAEVARRPGDGDMVPLGFSRAGCPVHSP